MIIIEIARSKVSAGIKFQLKLIILGISDQTDKADNFDILD